MITAIVQRTHNTLDMMHRGRIAQAPNVMKTLVRAAKDINNLPEAAFVDAKYVKGALAANRGLKLEPYVTEHDEPIIGVCNIHLLDGKFLAAQALYACFKPALASEADDYINLLNEELDIKILEYTIIFLANTLFYCIYDDMPELNTWASENYVASRKRGRVNEHFRSSDYTGVARKTLLSQAGVDFIITHGIFNMVDVRPISNNSNDVNVLSHVDHGLAKELTDLVELKDKRLDLVVNYGNITEYADLLKDGGLADIKYKNMKEYLTGVVEHLRVYKAEKASMVAQMAEIEANLKAKRARDERSAVAAAIEVKRAELVELRRRM